MEMFSFCKGCRSGFFYQRNGSHSRLREWCDECAPDHFAQLNRDRVAKHRKAKRAAQTPPNKRTGDKATRPVRGGKPKPKRPAVKRPVGNGLFASDPEPQRSTKRAKMGLPTDA